MDQGFLTTSCDILFLACSKLKSKIAPALENGNQLPPSDLEEGTRAMAATILNHACTLYALDGENEKAQRCMAALLLCHEGVMTERLASGGGSGYKRDSAILFTSLAQKCKSRARGNWPTDWPKYEYSQLLIWPLALTICQIAELAISASNRSDLTYLGSSGVARYLQDLACQALAISQSLALIADSQSGFLASIAASSCLQAQPIDVRFLARLAEFFETVAGRCRLGASFPELFEEKPEEDEESGKS